MADNQDTFEPLEFAYCGQRILTGGRLGICIAPIRDGQLQEASLYSHAGKVRWAVGGIYAGAEFSATSVRGLKNARFVRSWTDKEALIDWQSRNDQAESSIRTKKLETDARRMNELEAVMLPLRRQYEAYRRQRDHAGTEALAAAVLRALRSAPRADEGQE